MRIVTALFVAGAVGILSAACGGASHASAPAPAVPSATSGGAAAIKPPGEAKLGDRTRCPVSGEVFTVTADSPHQDYQGKTYYFCCQSCPVEFQKDPAKFVKG